MKNVLGGLLLSALLLVVAPCSSYAVTAGCSGPGMHEEGLFMTGAIGHRDTRMKKPGQRMWRGLMRLGLTENQREAIRDIRSKSMKFAIAKKADVRIAQIGLKDILAKNPVDMEAVRAKLKEIASLQTELRFSRIKAMEDIRAQLTPEQRKELRENLWQDHSPEKFRTRDGEGGMRTPAGPRGRMQPDRNQTDD